MYWPLLRCSFARILLAFIIGHVAFVPWKTVHAIWASSGMCAGYLRLGIAAHVCFALIADMSRIRAYGSCLSSVVTHGNGTHGRIKDLEASS